jgi:hypothetical protein
LLTHFLLVNENVVVPLVLRRARRLGPPQPEGDSRVGERDDGQRHKILDGRQRYAEKPRKQSYRCSSGVYAAAGEGIWTRRKFGENEMFTAPERFMLKLGPHVWAKDESINTAVTPCLTGNADRETPYVNV